MINTAPNTDLARSPGTPSSGAGAAQALSASDIDVAELEGHMRQVAAAQGIRAISMALSIDGERRFFGLNNASGAGGSDLITRFEAGCVSRTLTALLALSMQKEGALNVDAPVSLYVEELADDERFDTLTVRHLVQHTAGYEGLFNSNDDEVENMQVEDWLPRVRYAAQIFEPGTVINYEPSNALLASEIIARVGGRPVVDQLRDFIAQITGQHGRATQAVTSSGSGASGKSSAQRPGSLLPQTLTMKVELEDLLTIGEILRCDKADSGERGLDAAYREMKWIPKSSTDVRGHLPIGYGAGIAVYANGLIGHDGRAEEHGMCFRFSPERRLVIAIGATVGQYSLRHSLLEGVLERLQLPGKSPRPRHEETFDVGELAGHYAGNRIVKVDVTAEIGAVTVVMRQEGGFSASLRGEINSEGLLVFESKGPMWNPTFFREPRTGCPCLMLGIKAFKRTSGPSKRMMQTIRVMT